LRLFNNLILHFTTQTDDSHAVPLDFFSMFLIKILKKKAMIRW